MGCTVMPPRKGPIFSKALQPAKNDGMATVFIYRYGKEYKTGSWIGVYINDRKAFNIVEKGYTWLYLPLGKYTIRVERSWDMKSIFPDETDKPKFLTLNVQVGESYYVNYKVIKAVPQHSAFDVKVKTISEELIQEEEDVALKELQRCYYQKNKFTEINEE